MQGYTVCCTGARDRRASESSTVQQKGANQASERDKTPFYKDHKKSPGASRGQEIVTVQTGGQAGFGLGGKGSSGGSGGLPLPPFCKNGSVASSQAEKLGFEPIQAGSLDTLAQLDQRSGEQGANATHQDGSSSPCPETVKYQKRARAKYMSTPLAVSLAELRGELEQSYRNTVYCCSVILQEDGGLKTHYCGNRWCLVCGRIRTARAINAYMPILSGWEDPHLVTLTRRNVTGEILPKTLDEMLAAFTSCKRSMKRTHELEFKAVRKTECTYSLSRKDYHPHFHVIIEGEAQAHLLRDLWLNRLGADATADGQDVRPCDEHTLIEVFKYFTKLTTKGHSRSERAWMPPEALDMIFRAMRRRRVWQPLGFKLGADEDAAIEDDNIEVHGSASFKREAERVLWEWEQEVADWVDLSTGEALSEYRPAEKLRHFVEQACKPTTVSEKPDRPDRGGRGAVNARGLPSVEQRINVESQST